MSMETIFSLSFLLVAPFWLLMVFVPFWSGTERIIRSPLVAAPAAILYAVLVLPDFAQIFGVVTDASLPAIAKLLGTDAGATIGWVHFLAFDLFVGRWIYLDGRDRQITPFIVSPILFFVLMLGPIGLLLYLITSRLHLFGHKGHAFEEAFKTHYGTTLRDYCTQIGIPRIKRSEFRVEAK